MTIAPADLAVYRRTARLRASRGDEHEAKRRAKAWDVARRAAEFLRTHYPTVRVWVFGSLVHPGAYSVRSDIDLAVDGLPWRDYLRLWSALEAREPDFAIDLVDMALASDTLRTHIEREGVIV